MYSFIYAHCISNIFSERIGSSYEIFVLGKQAKFLYTKSHPIPDSKFFGRGFRKQEWKTLWYKRYINGHKEDIFLARDILSVSLHIRSIFIDSREHNQVELTAYQFKYLF